MVGLKDRIQVKGLATQNQNHSRREGDTPAGDMDFEVIDVITVIHMMDGNGQPPDRQLLHR